MLVLKVLVLLGTSAEVPSNTKSGSGCLKLFISVDSFGHWQLFQSAYVKFAYVIYVGYM